MNKQLQLYTNPYEWFCKGHDEYTIIQHTDLNKI